MKLNKDLVGKQIYGCEIDSLFRKNKPPAKPSAFTVISVGRKYFALQKEGVAGHQKFDPSTGHSEESIRAGYTESEYKFFHTLDECQRWAESEIKLHEINTFFASWNQKPLSIDQIEKIHAVLNENEF